MNHHHHSGSNVCAPSSTLSMICQHTGGLELYTYTQYGPVLTTCAHSNSTQAAHMQLIEISNIPACSHTCQSPVCPSHTCLQTYTHKTAKEEEATDTTSIFLESPVHEIVLEINGSVEARRTQGDAIVRICPYYSQLYSEISLVISPSYSSCKLPYCFLSCKSTSLLSFQL